MKELLFKITGHFKFRPLINWRLFILIGLAMLNFSCSENDDLEIFENVTQIENESLQLAIDNGNSQVDIQIPMVSLSEIGAVALEGYPKTIKKFENGKLSYWARYYFRPDGKILRLDYGHSSTTSEKFTYNYHYDGFGKLVKLVGWDVFDFYYDKERIIKVEGYNAAWYGEYDIFYDYNDQGQVIQRLDMFYGTTPMSSQKTIYTYLDNGNLSSIETYVGSDGGNGFELYTATNFSNYIESENLFLELEIVPGQRELQQFPGAREFKHLTSSGYDVYETFSYRHDHNGRVIEKSWGNYKVVYEYY